MQVTEIDTHGLRHELKVVIPAGQLDERVSARLADIAHTIRMPGFRPGKVPVKLVRQKYGTMVRSEVVEEAVDESARAALAEKSLRPAVQPKIDIAATAEGADVEFTIVVEVMPDVAPMDFATIKLEREKAEIDEAEVDKTLGEIALHRGTSETVSRAAEFGDVVVIDFVGRQDGVAFDGGAAENYELKLGTGSFIPGFEDQLVGRSAGDTCIVKVTFPEAYAQESLAGKPAEFDVIVHAVKAPKAAAIDDELAKGLGLDSLEALKTALREEIGRDLDQLARLKVKRALLDVLAANHDFPVPESMVDSEFEAVWKQIEAEIAAGRSDPADAGKSEEDLKTEYRALAQRRVRLGLLLGEVGRMNNLTVSQDDTNRALMNEARRFPGQEHMVFQYYRNNPEAMEQLKAPLYEEKVIDFILELAQVTEKVVTAEALRHDPDEAKKKAEDKADE
jgi:trigger factor